LPLGIGLALACAAVTQLGFLCKHRGATSAPLVDARRPLQSARSLFASKWFAVGMAVAVVAWVLHVAALAVAPLSTVQAVMSTGVVMMAVLGAKLFGHVVGARQWAGVAMTAAGLTLLVVTLPTAEGHSASFAMPVMLAFELGTLALGVFLIAAPKLGAPAHHHGALLGGAAGILFGVSDVSLKALTGADGLVGLVMSPWIPVAVVASVLAFLASARGFQEGDAVPVIACTSTAANLTTIVGGILVFGDALAAGMMLIVQVAAFAMVAAASLLTPTGHGAPLPQAQPA
jgi:drug/metabolite transporter (DMT)-like permease